MILKTMAIVKATYTRKGGGAKASIRYIEHRPGKDGEKTNRVLFGADGLMGRWQAYQIIDDAKQGSYFFRLILSPDPKGEDTEKDLHLREVAERTMNALEERFDTQIPWIAAIHADHAPHRHVHVVAVVPGRLNVQDFKLLRTSATEACKDQRRQRDAVRELGKQEEEQGRERG